MLKQLTLSVAIALTSVSFLTACDDDDNTSHVEENQQAQFDTIVAAAQETPELSILTEAVVAAGLVDTLSTKQSPAPFTVFAPTDQAFADLLAATGLTKEQLLADKDLLTSVLTYHVVPKATVMAADINFGSPIQSVEGGAFTINNDQGKAVITDAKGSMANIIATDILTNNGIVHIIDKVIMPADKSLVAVAQENQDFSILVEAVTAAGLADTLATTPDLTVFAPTNDAFASLLAELGLTKEQLLSDKALLTSVLKYHVVPDLVYSSEVVAGDVTSLLGEKFSFGADGKITDGRIRQTSLVATDIQASNGVIHVIDKVILPPAAI